jgi:hypothetical protein
MNIAVLLAAFLKVAPVALEVADELKLNTVAADLLRRSASALIADAKKTATPVDDALAAVASAIMNHIADLLSQGLLPEAKALIAACTKLWGAAA